MKGDGRRLTTILLGMLLGTVLILSGCNGNPGEPTSSPSPGDTKSPPVTPGSTWSPSEPLTLCGAWDVLPPSLANQVESGFEEESGLEVELTRSNTALTALRQGQCDAVLLGYDMTEDEQQGLSIDVVAYDAVCMIIDEYSYEGGEWMGKPVSQVGHPTSGTRTGGLRQLTMEDVRGMLGWWLEERGQRWEWCDDLDVWQRQMNEETGLPRIDPITGGHVYDWSPACKTGNDLSRFQFIPGKYDTQTHLYRLAEVDEQAVMEKYGVHTQPNLETTEMEMLKDEYWNDYPYTSLEKRASPDMATNFSFKMGFVSRRAASAALASGDVPIRVVAVEGMDPLENEDAVYDGSYPLSRTIQLVTRGDAADSGLADYLLSSAGQQILEDAGFLPTVPKS